MANFSNMLSKMKYKNQEESFSTGGRGRYMKKEPPSPSVKGYFGVQRPPPKPKSEQPPMPPSSSSSSSSNTKSITNSRSQSVPSLRTNVDLRVKESPPHLPAKPRSTSVRLHPKKTLSFKGIRKMFAFGSRSELEDGNRLRNDEQTVGTYHKLPNRPRSFGSDCSNSSYTHGADFNRNDSIRGSGHSRLSHGINTTTVDSVFDHGGPRQFSYDSNDFINHAPSNSTDSNLRPYSVALPRSSSSSSLKNFGIQTRVGDNRHHSIPAMPLHSTDVPYGFCGFGRTSIVTKIPVRTQEDASESLWEDSNSFDFTQPVLPSHPEYRQIAEDLMTASPPRRNSAEMPPGGALPLLPDVRRMSDASTTAVDPRRVSNDSGVESSKPRSQPSTPITQTLANMRTEGTSSPEMHTSPPHDYFSQRSSSNSSLPQGWTSATTPQGLTYYLDHNTHTTHWKLPHDTSTDDSTNLPAGWEVVQSSQYGTYFVNHNNKTAMYQHPCHSRPPPPYHWVPHSQEAEQWSSMRERKQPHRSHSHRDTQNYRVMDPNASLPRRSKSFKDQETQNAMATVWHSKQLSTVTYVPPSPYQIAEIPGWLKDYVEAPFGEDNLPWSHYTYEDLNGLDTMIKRMLKKGSEQIVRQFEYYRAAIDQEINSRGMLRQRRPINEIRRGTDRFQYPRPPSFQSGGSGTLTSHQSRSMSYNYTANPALNHGHTPNYMQSHSHTAMAGSPYGMRMPTGGSYFNHQTAVYPSWSSSSERSGSSTRTLRARPDLDLLQDEETFV